VLGRPVIDRSVSPVYKVLKSGKAWAKSPLAGTSCKCKYKGTLTPANGGKQFDAGEIDFAPVSRSRCRTGSRVLADGRSFGRAFRTK
jgi:hypothetical protein